MKDNLYHLILLILSLIVISCSKHQKQSTLLSNHIPIPTEVFQNMENEEQYENRKELWLESIHKTVPNDNWKEINEQNFNILAKQRVNQQQKAVEQFANGFIEGEWFERGSSNQAGNLMNIDFEKNSELIYGLAVNGSVWKSNLTGTSWQVLNNDIVFDTDVLKVIEISSGQRRIFVSKGQQIMYSDDEGQSWQNSNGFSNQNGKAIDLVQLNDVNKTIVYLYYDSSVPANKIAKSVDNGVTFTDEVFLTSTNSSGHKASMATFNNGAKAYILDAHSGVYIFENGTATQVSVGSGFGAGTYFKLQATATSTDTVLYVLRNKSELYKSLDQGLTFALVNTLPVNSWNVGIEVAENDPNAVYFGEMELYRSIDGGMSYTSNYWADYYSDVVNEVHADIMNLKSFVKNDGTEFCLIANHGGLSISYDHLTTTVNIGLNGLNIGQFYDVITNPVDPYRIYGGTQDQGFQYTNSASSPGVLTLEQQISGDYGHLQMSNNGELLWIQYPGADFRIYSNMASGVTPNYAGSYNLDGADMPAYDWIVPTASAPHLSDNYIYVAGGDINGGSGSHLVKLQSLGVFSINATQSAFDFKQASGGLISAINASKVDANRLYVGTDNGKFYYSNDDGVTWMEGQINNGPGVLYLYGASIVSANLTPDLVFFGGSGYSNNACFMSTDGGQTLTSISNGLPSTIIHDMAMSPDDEFVFAATDAGPYVYYIAQDEWFYLGGTTAPVGYYYSVDYVDALDIVRFGTHGRGIWDLNITKNSANINELGQNVNDYNIYPNPITNHIFYLQNTNGIANELTINIYNLKGQLIYSKSRIKTAANQQSISVALPQNMNGMYLIQLVNQQNVILSTQKVIVR